MLLSLIHIPLWSPGSACEEYYQADIEKGKSENPSLKVLSTKKVREAEALPGYEVDFTFTEAAATYRAKVLYMVSGRLGFGAGVVALEDQWDLFSAVIDAMLQSFVPPSPEFKPPPVTKLTEATMAKSADPKTFAPVRVTDTFRRDTPKIYCVFKISGVAGIKATSRWVPVEGDGMTDKQVGSISLTLKRDIETPVWTYFYMAPPAQSWWVGDYQVTLYIKDKEVVTLPFTITR